MQLVFFLVCTDNRQEYCECCNSTQWMTSFICPAPNDEKRMMEQKKPLFIVRMMCRRQTHKSQFKLSICLFQVNWKETCELSISPQVASWCCSVPGIVSSTNCCQPSWNLSMNRRPVLRASGSTKGKKRNDSHDSLVCLTSTASTRWTYLKFFLLSVVKSHHCLLLVLVHHRFACRRASTSLATEETCFLFCRQQKWTIFVKKLTKQFPPKPNKNHPECQLCVSWITCLLQFANDFRFLIFAHKI